MPDVAHAVDHVVNPGDIRAVAVPGQHQLGRLGPSGPLLIPARQRRPQPDVIGEDALQRRSVDGLERVDHPVQRRLLRAGHDTDARSAAPARDTGELP
jgi:hypothetical protein